MPRFALALLLIALCAHALAPTPARAAAPEVSHASVEPFISTVGDRLTLTIVVEHDAGTEVTGPGADGNFGELDLIDIAQPNTVTDGPRWRTTLTYTVTSFVTGAATTPAIELTYRDVGGDSIFTTPPIPYTVDSVLAPGEENTLRPLKPQLSIPQPAPSPFVPASVVAAMTGLTAFGYWLVRRAILVPPPPIAVAPPPLPPPTAAGHARHVLDEIASSDLARTDPAEYYARIAGIVRRYLTDAFGFPAYALTRTEIVLGMTDAGIDRWPARLTANLLEQADAAEFALARHPDVRLAQDLDAAYEIIRLTEVEGHSAPDPGA